MRRFGKAYVNASNLIDLSGVLLNFVVIISHIFGGFLGQWKLRLASVSMLIMWIQLFRVLIIFDVLAFYLRLIVQLAKEMWPFAIVFGVSILMCTNLFFLAQSDLMWQ